MDQGPSAKDRGSGFKIIGNRIREPQSKGHGALSIILVGGGGKNLEPWGLIRQGLKQE